MTKILSINDGILINKNNVQQSYSSLSKYIGSNKSVTYTLSGHSGDGVVEVFFEGNGTPAKVAFDIHGGKIRYSVVAYGEYVSVASSTDNSITINCPSWSTAMLIDYNCNSWS